MDGCLQAGEGGEGEESAEEEEGEEISQSIPQALSRPR